MNVSPEFFFSDFQQTDEEAVHGKRTEGVQNIKINTEQAKFWSSLYTNDTEGERLMKINIFSTKKKKSEATISNLFSTFDDGHLVAWVAGRACMVAPRPFVKIDI